jgi:hypothetical protein
MGKLIYADVHEYEFDDRVLAHLQIVMGLKLRRREGFYFTFQNDGMQTLWIDPSTPLYFKYLGGRMPAINRAWLQVLSDSAATSRGLVLTNEPDGSKLGPDR